MHEYVKSLYYGEFHPPKYTPNSVAGIVITPLFCMKKAQISNPVILISAIFSKAYFQAANSSEKRTK